MPNPNAGYQEELFKEFAQETPQRKKNPFAIGVSLAQRSFALSFEKLLFISMIAIVALVLVFAIGVERGKQLKIPIPEVRLVTPLVTPPESEPQRTETISPKPPVAAMLEETKPAVASVSKKPTLLTQGYTLQIVTYRDKRSAEKIVSELRSKGYDSFVAPKGNFLAICIGKYPSLEDASKIAKSFRKQYPDCFVRKW